MNNEPTDKETRQELREKRLKKRREQMRVHGRNLAKIYKDVILKRLKRRRVEKK